MRIKITRRAGGDLEAISRYVGAENPTAAAELVSALNAAITALAEYPNLGHPTYPEGRRVRTVPRLPYRVFYSVTDDEIVILHVRHTSRRPLRSLR